MIFLKSIITATIFWSTIAYSNILLMTHAYNRPDFIEIQDKTFKKFLKDDYEFVVFNDAPGEPMARAIESTCQSLGLRCIRIPQSIHTKPYLPKGPGEDGNHSCKRCAHVVQYSLDILGVDHDDLVAIIDSDMFLIKPFSIRHYMQDIQLAGVPQSRDNGVSRVEYFWNGLVFFDMPALPDKKSINFNCGRVEGIGTDVGGYTFYYLQNHPHLRRKNIDGLYTHDIKELKNVFFTQEMIWLIDQSPDNIEFFVHGTFLHYRGGTNWNGKSPEYHQQKTNILQNFIAQIMQ